MLAGARDPDARQWSIQKRCVMMISQGFYKRPNRATREAHTRSEDLALNFGVPAETFSNIPLHDLYIFQGQVPGPLEADLEQARGDAGPMPFPSTFQLSEVAPTEQTKGGFVKIADSSTFRASKTIAVAIVTIHPGGMRAMHWHPNADEWQYYIAGQGELTVFDTGPKAVSQNFNPGDIGYVKRAYGHYLRNTGNTDLVYLEVFRSSYYSSVNLSDWLTHSPPALVAQHFNIDPAVIAPTQPSTGVACLMAAR